MQCPKCGFDHRLQTTECLKCGIVFSKYKPPAPSANAESQREAAGTPGVSAAAPDEKMAAAVVSSFVTSMDALLSDDADQSPAALRKAAITEFKYRLLALPLALLVARWLTGTGFGIVAGMLAMVVHESGHAIAAWLAGRWAIPTFWFTMIGESRSWFMVLLVTSALLFAGFRAWKSQRWGWVCAAAAVLVLQMIILSGPTPGAVIIFAGDGGAMVLATILMATFYAPRDSALTRSWGLRWALLMIGTLAFMHVYRLWSGSWDNIPFGEIEGGNLSDPSLLTEMYGWSVIQLVDRYLLLAKVCFTAMGAMYVWGLVSAYLATRLPTSQQSYKGIAAPAIR